MSWRAVKQTSAIMSLCGHTAVHLRALVHRDLRMQALWWLTLARLAVWMRAGAKRVGFHNGIGAVSTYSSAVKNYLPLLGTLHALALSCAPSCIKSAVIG